MCAHVVVAEDDPKQAELIRRYLENEGHRVTVVHDGRAALDEARAGRPELMLLDVMMPRVDGLDVCRVLRADPALAGLPVLMLTARSTEDDLLLGLDLGADDYMTKPYSPRELMARVRTLLRRAAATVPAAAAVDPVLRVGAVTVDPARHEVTCDGRPVACTPGEFALLALLAAEPGRVFSRAQIIQHQHGFDRWFTSRTVDVHVMNLRRKIEPAPDRPSRLLTVYGVGYKLVADAGRTPDAGTSATPGQDVRDGA
ncbi:response regulator transcription factor [Actinacidiphila acidipaludis]|uniref:Response regulator transcription factor n=1 Tax=Actinacidiphila acidipaludis TaxID=2873382 RepID=A0ABS7QKY1_9ACTN|nr:response regulator transcription factor [Streptomyces acidipaludis]MBY8882449.1 response regulator transcription factor [Streptomyces acidipaludis]